MYEVVLSRSLHSSENDKEYIVSVGVAIIKKTKVRRGRVMSRRLC